MFIAQLALYGIVTWLMVGFVSAISISNLFKDMGLEEGFKEDIENGELPGVSATFAKKYPNMLALIILTLGGGYTAYLLILVFTGRYKI